jgi:ATP-dependent Clp protease ATP-binding subunit ClpC
MFERFTDRARQAVAVAADEARELGADHVGPEHVLLGLLREEDTIAANALDDAGVTLQDAREVIVEHGPAHPVRTAGEIPFDPAAKRVLERSLREAVRLGDNFIAGEHLLLGLLREEEGLTAEILEDPEAIRERLLQLRQSRPERRRGKRAKLGREAQAALTRARELASEEGASEVDVEHLRRALGPPGPD